MPVPKIGEAGDGDGEGGGCSWREDVIQFSVTVASKKLHLGWIVLHRETIRIKFNGAVIISG